MKTTKVVVSLLMTVILVLSLVACSKPAAEAPKADAPAASNADAGIPKSLVLSSGPSGGNWYSMGAVFAEVLTNAGTQCSSEAGGGTQNIIAVGEKQSDIAFCNLFAMLDAYEAKEPYTREYKDVITLMSLETNLMYLIVPADSAIAGVKDLKGKTVAVSSVGSTAYTMAMDVLKCAGLDPEKDLTIKAASMSEDADLMKDRLADAFLIMTGVSNATLMDLAQSIDVKFVDLEEDVRKAMADLNPGYFDFQHPAGTYKGEDKGFITSCSKGALICSADMSEEEAYWITKTLVEHFDDIKATCAWLSAVTPETMQDVGSLTMHPGAKKYFDGK